MTKISITVKPGSKKGPLVQAADDGSLVVFVREIAADGMANEAVVKLLAEHLDTPKSHINIVRGHSSRHKIVEIK